MKLNKYTVDELKDAVVASRSIRQALIKLGVAPYGGNYATFKRAVKEFDINTSHFTGKGSNKGVRPNNYKKTEDYLCKGGPVIISDKLRRRLLRDGFFEHRCSICSNTQWSGNPIPLELHHGNGDRGDNRIENLSVVCPNCHAGTRTYRGKNKKKW